MATPLIFAAVSPTNGYAQAGEPAPVLSAPPSGKVYELGNGITPPKFLHQNAETKPCASVPSGKLKGGTVLLSMVINEAGDVSQVKVENASAKDFAACAIQMAEGYHFSPAMRKKIPVAVHMYLSVDLKLK